MALRGSLTEQLPEDGTAKELFQSIQIKRQEFDTKNKKTSQISEILIEELEHKIPDNWMWVRLETIAKVDGGNTPNIQEISEIGEIPYFKVSDMNVSGNEKEMHIASFFVNEKYKGKIFPAGTIIFPKNGGAALTNKRRILVADSVIDLNTAGCYPYIKDILGWMNLFFSTIDFGQFNTGTTIPTVSVGLIKNLIMPLPPYAEQQRIVKCVEEIFSLLAIIDKLQSQYRNNQISLKSKLIDAAIQGKLTEQLPEDGTAEELYQQIQQEKHKLLKEGKLKRTRPLVRISEEIFPYHYPRTWHVCYIDDIAFVTKLAGFEYTNYIADNMVPEGIPLIKGKNVQNGHMVLTFESFISEETSKMLPRSQAYKKCLLTPYVGTIGNIAIFDGSFKAHLGSNVGKIELIYNDNQFVLEEYVLYYLRSSIGHKQLTKFQKATAQESISIDAIRNVIIPIPPIAEQKRIVAKLEELSSWLGC